MDSQIKKLSKRAKKADKTAAFELLEIYYADVFAYLRRLCGNRADSEDLTQQTFLKVWRSLENYKRRSKFSTWVYRIAYNTYVDWQRKNRNNITRSAPEQWWQECLDHNPGPFANTAQRQTAQRLYRAVEEIDDDKKHAVHLHYYQGLSLAETAKVLNISTSTVKYRLREAIKMLRTKMTIEKIKPDQEQAIAIAEGELL